MPPHFSTVLVLILQSWHLLRETRRWVSRKTPLEHPGEQEFVVNMADETLADKMVATSASLPHGESELVLTGLTPAGSTSSRFAHCGSSSLIRVSGMATLESDPTAWSSARLSTRIRDNSRSRNPALLQTPSCRSGGWLHQTGIVEPATNTKSKGPNSESRPAPLPLGFTMSQKNYLLKSGTSPVIQKAAILRGLFEVYREDPLPAWRVWGARRAHQASVRPSAAMERLCPG